MEVLFTVMKPGGKLYLTVPAFSSSLGEGAGRDGTVYDDDAFHARWLGPVSRRYFPTAFIRCRGRVDGPALSYFTHLRLRSNPHRPT